MTLTLRRLAAAALAGAAACRPVPAGRVPAASFLIAAGDSTFWVATDSAAFHVRRSSILLTRYGGRFYEVYVTDDDRSFYDAVIVGQRIYRRDILTGDSVAVFHDPEIDSLAAAYAAAHPRQRPLAPDEEEAEHPSLSATTETDIVDVAGPLLTFEQSADMKQTRGRELHEVHRSVIDLRSGRIVALDDLVPDSLVGQLLREGKRAAQAAFDSVRRSKDARARRANEILGSFVLNPESFSFEVTDSGPAIAFFVPGRGDRAGGYALPLPPLPIPRAGWWDDIRLTIPNESPAHADIWHGAGYDLVARYDSTSDNALLVVRTAKGREWDVTRVPTPVASVYWLDGPARDTLTLRALSRAFDEEGLDSDRMRTTSEPAPGGSAARHSAPRHSAPRHSPTRHSALGA